MDRMEQCSWDRHFRLIGYVVDRQLIESGDMWFKTTSRIYVNRPHRCRRAVLESVMGGFVVTDLYEAKFAGNRSQIVLECEQEFGEEEPAIAFACLLDGDPSHINVPN